MMTTWWGLSIPRSSDAGSSTRLIYDATGPTTARGGSLPSAKESCIIRGGAEATGAAARHSVGGQPVASPFPGMDPYLERYWGGIPHTLITYARDHLQEALPDDLRARVEERVF